MLVLEIVSSLKVSHTKSELRKLSDLIGAAKKFYYKFMIRMPLFGSDSNIILTEPNKELSSRDLRSRLQNLIKLLQVSIQRRSETQLTTFHLCLVSSAWEEDKVKPNLKTLLKSKQPVWRMRVKAVAARRSHFRTSWRPWETPRGESWCTIAMWGWRRLTSTSLSSPSWSILHPPTEHNFLSI